MLRTPWQRQEEKQGITLCGHPVDKQGQDDAAPLGTAEFKKRWLEKRRDDQKVAWEKLLRIVDHSEPGQGVRVAAWHLLRQVLTRKNCHLWPTVDLEAQQAWNQLLDQDMREVLARLLQEENVSDEG